MTFIPGPRPGELGCSRFTIHYDDLENERILSDGDVIKAIHSRGANPNQITFILMLQQIRIDHVMYADHQSLS